MQPCFLMWKAGGMNNTARVKQGRASPILLDHVKLHISFPFSSPTPIAFLAADCSLWNHTCRTMTLGRKRACTRRMRTQKQSAKATSPEPISSGNKSRNWLFFTCKDFVLFIPTFLCDCPYSSLLGHNSLFYLPKMNWKKKNGRGIWQKGGQKTE